MDGVKDGSKIEWTDYTFNPWWGCAKVSPACKHCYAETWAKRTGHAVWGVGGPRRFFGDKHWRDPVKWNARAERDGVRRRVFCASMADVFELHPDPDVNAQLDEARARLFDLIVATPRLDWLLLTKRPQHLVDEGGGLFGDSPCMMPGWWQMHGAPPNVWLGTTAESHVEASWRLLALGLAAQELGHPITFCSYEPGLGPIDFTRLDNGEGGTFDALRGAVWDEHAGGPMDRLDILPLSWVICGGESGAIAKVRPFDLGWARATRDACAQARVPFFMKQLGRRPVDGGRVVRLADRKGGTEAEWPADLRGCRAFPASKAVAP